MHIEAPARVVGRVDELAELERWLDRPAGSPPGFLLEGEPGIGKSTVWQAALGPARERGLRVLVARPSEAERELPFAALTDLLDRLELADLPVPQRSAIDVALRRAESSTPPDPTALGLAVRAVLRSAPTLVAIDDLQWLDPESTRTLAFALRRHDESSPLVLATARSGSTAVNELADALTEGGLSRLEVGPLSLEGIAAIVRFELDVSISRPTLVRLWETSRGNAFFALELMRAAHDEGGIDAAFALPTTPTLEALVASRLGSASPLTRETVAAVAALSRATISLVASACGTGSAELAEAVDLDLLNVDGERLTVTHPLLASAAYYALPPAERRRLHERLAQICSTPEERALHLAVGAVVPDESIAATIESAADAAERRGARATAATLLAHSVRLTPPDEPAAIRRRLGEASQRLAAGDAAGARDRLESLIDDLPAGSARAEALYRLAEARWDDLAVMTDLCNRAVEEATDDSTRAWAYLFLGQTLNSRCDFRGSAHAARAAVALAERAGDDRTLALALAAQIFVTMLLGEGFDDAVAARALALEDAFDGNLPIYEGPSLAIGVVLSYVGEPVRSRQLLLRQLARAADRGDELARAGVLLHLVCLELRAGALELAERYAVEVHELGGQLGLLQGEAYGWLARLVIDVELGREDDARRRAGRILSFVEGAGDRLMGVAVRSSMASLELSKGDFAAAAVHLDGVLDQMRACGWREPAINPVHAQTAEALVGLGDIAAATAVVDELERIALPLGRRTALAAAARCRGLIAAANGDVDEAARAFESALELHPAWESPLERARTLLAAGSFLRRAKRRAAARESLLAAAAIFAELGATLWSARTESELARFGGRAAASGLTPTELRVAQLVADGRSNKETAAALFVTVRTVESNLSRIYAKLGVRSRTELAGRVRDVG